MARLTPGPQEQRGRVKRRSRSAADPESSSPVHEAKWPGSDKAHRYYALVRAGPQASGVLVPGPLRKVLFILRRAFPEDERFRSWGARLPREREGQRWVHCDASRTRRRSRRDYREKNCSGLPAGGIFLRLLVEFLLAAGAAEIESFSLVFGSVGRGSRFDAHTANRINGFLWGVLRHFLS